MAIKLKGGIKMSNHQNYNKMHKPVEDTVTKPEEIKVEVTTDEAVKDDDIVLDATGVVVDCTRLNIRTLPGVNGHVICTIAAGERLTVHLNKMFENWYRVTTANGISGFCMKKYIHIES